MKPLVDIVFLPTKRMKSLVSPPATKIKINIATFKKKYKLKIEKSRSLPNMLFEHCYLDEENRFGGIQSKGLA